MLSARRNCGAKEPSEISQPSPQQRRCTEVATCLLPSGLPEELLLDTTQDTIRVLVRKGSSKAITPAGGASGIP